MTGVELWLVGVEVDETGGAGGAAGVCAAEAVPAVAVPTPLIAVTLNTYEVPAVKPVIVAVVAVDCPSVKVTQVRPPSREYSMV